MANLHNGMWMAILIGLLPYAAISWAASALDPTADGMFWKAFLVLVLVRTAFSVMELTAGLVGWRLYGRRAAIKELSASLKRENLPKRQFDHHDFAEYVAHAQADDSVPQEQKLVLRDMHCMALGVEKATVLRGMRMRDALDAALVEHSRAR